MKSVITSNVMIQASIEKRSKVSTWLSISETKSSQIVTLSPSTGRVKARQMLSVEVEMILRIGSSMTHI